MSITAGLRRAVQGRPDEQAISDGPRSLTNRQLVDRVSRLAGALQARGIEPGGRVALLASNRAEYVEMALATAWSGTVLTPVNTRWSVAEIAYQLNDSGARLLVIDPAWASMLPALHEECPTLEDVWTLSSDGDRVPGAESYDDVVGTATPVNDRLTHPDELWLLFYTGGTTGTPKGVMLGARQVLASSYGTAAATGFLNLPDRYLHCAPLFHIAGFSAVVWTTLSGGTHVMLRDFEVGAVARTIEAERITALSLVPTMIERLLAHLDRHGGDLSSVRSLNYGGSPMAPKVLDQVVEKLPQVRVRQSFGMTETAPVVTMLRDEDHRDPEHPTRRLSVGRAAPHCEIRVVDADDTDLPAGEVGEILVRGENVMLGYWNQPELTAQTLRGGWMHTGDLGRLDTDGYLYVVDRLKDMIVTGGENVYSAEVEKVLARHPAVVGCAVVGVPDDQWGERVHAVVVLGPEEATAEELREWVGGQIARYKAPRSFDFVDELPLSTVGKVLKRAVRADVIRRIGEKGTNS